MLYDELPQQIKELVSFHLNEAFQSLSLQKLVTGETCSLLLENSYAWDLQFTNLGQIAAGLQRTA